MLDISTINPYIRVAMHSVIPRNHELKRRIIFDYELIYIADGEFVFNYNDVDHFCKTGQFIFIRPDVPHSFKGIKTDLVQPHIHFDITHTADSHKVPVCFKGREDLSEQEARWIREDAFSDFPLTPFVIFNDTRQALDLFYEIVDTNTSALSRKAKFIQLFEMLIADNFKKVFESESRFLPVEKQVKAFIDFNQGLTVNLDSLAKHFNYSKCYLDRCFQKRYGVGVIAYRNQRRMQMAKELLQQHSVSAVAEALGFSSIYVFSRAFKKSFGVSPSTYKNTLDLSV